MRVAVVKFGETHAVTNLADRFKGKQVVTIACMGDYLLSRENEGRIFIRESDEDIVGCQSCRFAIGLNQYKDQGAQQQ